VTTAPTGSAADDAIPAVPLPGWSPAQIIITTRLARPEKASTPPSSIAASPGITSPMKAAASSPASTATTT